MCQQFWKLRGLSRPLGMTIRYSPVPPHLQLAPFSTPPSGLLFVYAWPSFPPYR